MGYWECKVAGPEPELKQLAQSLRTERLSVSRRGEGFYVRSSCLGEDPDVKSFRDAADRIVDCLSGAARLLLGATESIRLVGFAEIDGGGKVGRQIAIAVVGHIKIRGYSATVRMTDSNGNVVEYRPADAAIDWVQSAMSNEAVFNVLKIMSPKNEMDWVNLYRIYEIVVNDVKGLGEIVRREWATKKAINRFKRTANHPDAVGLHARHGFLKEAPPERPMLLSEARALVETIVHGWLRERS